jgi:hypothetical protein
VLSKTWGLTTTQAMDDLIALAPTTGISYVADA